MAYYQPPTREMIERDRELQRFARMHEANRNEVNTPPGTYFGQDTLEMTGLPSIARGVGHLRDGEPGEALPEMALGGLGVFGMFAGAGARPGATPPRIPRIPRPLPEMAPRRVPIETLDPATARDIGAWGGRAAESASDVQIASVPIDDLLQGAQYLEDPARAAEYAARQTPIPPVAVRNGRLVDGRHRLEAARLRGQTHIDTVDLGQFSEAPRIPRPLPEIAEEAPLRPLARAPQVPDEFGETMYHGTSAQIDGPLRPSRHPGLHEPTGISLSPNPDIASDFGTAVYPVQTRGAIGSGEEFMTRARSRMERGMSAEQASAETQQEFLDAGYRGVRFGNREITMFEEGDVRSAIGQGQPPRRQPDTRSAEQGAAMIRDGRFMRSEAEYARAMGAEPAPAARMQPDAGGGRGGRRSLTVSELRSRADPFGPVNPWDDRMAPITVEEVRQAMRRGVQESDTFSHGPSSREWTREDHINRIATLAAQRGDDPITLTSRGGVNDGMHRLAAAIVRGDETMPAVAASDGALGHGDLPVPLNPTQLEFHAGRWQVVTDQGEVLERLPANTSLDEAGARLADWRSRRPQSPEPPHWSQPRTQPDGGSAQTGSDAEVIAYRGHTGEQRPGPFQMFTSDPNLAGSFADNAARSTGRTGANVRRERLRLGRTLTIDAGGARWTDNIDPNAIPDDAIRARVLADKRSGYAVGGDGEYSVHARSIDRIADEARRDGYDSVTVTNFRDGGAREPATTYVIFDEANQLGPSRAQPNAGPPRPPPRTLPRRPTQ